MEPQKFPRKKVNAEKKKTQELLRRWRIKVTQIEIIAQYENFDPFFQIIIGGDYQKEMVKITKEEKMTRMVGEIGMVFKSDVLQEMINGDRRTFQCELEAEFRASYAQIEQEIMHVELWNYQTCGINILKGIESKPLLEIVKGDVNMVWNIKIKVGKAESQYARILMKCVFQEIWDFYMTFRDWRIIELLPDKKKKKQVAKKKEQEEEDDLLDEEENKDKDEDLDDWMAEEPELEPMIMFQLNDDKKPQIYSVSTEGREPYWPNIEGGMNFRGTVGDVNQQTMSLTVYNCHSGMTVIGRKTVSLS